jgi:hypothetical protein
MWYPADIARVAHDPSTSQARSTCRTSRQNESLGFNRDFQREANEFDLGMDVA